MQAYGDLFAKVYNRQWRDFAVRVAPLIREYYESTSFGRRHKTLLDLCCGTGQLCVHFLENGYRVVGLDISPGMLKHARENALPYLTAQQADFVRADAADFELQEAFGLVVSTYDALNHLPDLDALRGCARSTYKVMLDGGFFIFDLNTRKGLANWNQIKVDPGDEIFLLNRGIFDDQIDKAWTKVTGFVRVEERLYARFDETVYNTVFELQAVKDVLQDTGFDQVYFAQGTNLAAPILEPEGEVKIFCVAVK